MCFEVDFLSFIFMMSNNYPEINHINSVSSWQLMCFHNYSILYIQSYNGNLFVDK